MGENHHQKAALYRDPSSKEIGICSAKKLHGRETSSNIILDASAAIELLKEFGSPATVIIKHTNPVGVAIANSIHLSFLDALACDKPSLFGTTLGFNDRVDRKLAGLIMKEMADIRLETIVAPSVDKDAIDILSKKEELVIFELPSLAKTSDKELDYKKVVGGLFVQDVDLKAIARKDLKIMTKKLPAEAEMDSLIFGDKIAKHAKSNAIVLCKGTKTVGMGIGQTSREDAIEIAFRKAGVRAKGATLASDARFSRKDVVDYSHKAGIVAIIQQGGASADKELTDACDKYGISMVFTGCRHFKH